MTKEFLGGLSSFVCRCQKTFVLGMTGDHGGVEWSLNPVVRTSTTT